MKQAHRVVLKWARILHVYLTLFGFALLLFFAVSGFMLNHEDWFLPRPTTRGTMPTEWLPDNRDAIVDKLRGDFGVVGELAEFDVQPDRLRVVFKADEGTTTALIRRPDGATEVTSEVDRGREWTTIVEGTMPRELLVPDDPTKELPIVERLRKDFAARGEVSSPPRYEKESESFQVVFKSPGYLATAVIRASDGQTKVTHQTRGVVGILLDLHRGKDTGFFWSLIIDGVAILFVVVSITGLILWSSLKSRAQNGGRLLLVGLAVGLGVYFAFVPR